MITDLKRYICKDCQAILLLDGSMPVGSQPCYKCGSKSIDHAPLGRNHKHPVITLDSVLPLERKLILKVYNKIQNFNPLYFISSQDNDDLKPVCLMTPHGIEQLHIHEMLTEIPGEKIIENYFLHRSMLSNISTSKYYHLKLPNDGNN